MATNPICANMTLNQWTRVCDYKFPGGWQGASDRQARARSYCRQLEAGGILFFPETPFELPGDDREFLISQRQSDSRFHKNISYRPRQDKLQGAASADANDRERLHRIMRDYSRHASAFVADFLSPYEGAMALDYASFRPLEERGRDLPTHKRNDLLHVDAFPTRPTRGGRILRVFHNINPREARTWLTGEPFDRVAAAQAKAAGLGRYAALATSGLFKLRRRAARLLGKAGWRLGGHSAYDLFVLHFHDWLKDNSQFQAGGARMRSEFPPGCTWMVYTDGVPHAALSGQFALEHTYIIGRQALVAPELAPISVLERLSGAALGD